MGLPGDADPAHPDTADAPAGRGDGQRVAGGKALPAAVLRQIVARTDGVPLFVEELTKTVLEAGGLQEEAEHYDLTGSLPALAIPATLQDALRARLDRLPEGKVVAQLGAVLGRTFAYELLQAVAPLDELALWRGLVQLVQAEVLYQRGVPPQATYTFKHALIQEAAYQSLAQSTRQQYHQRIAQVLAAQFPDLAETQPELLAQHYTEAGFAEEALGYWQQAGQQASARSAYVEAISHSHHRAGGAQDLPETPERTHQHELDLLHRPRSALQLATRAGGARGGTRLHPGACVVSAGGGDASSLSRSCRDCGDSILSRAEFQTARGLAKQLLGLAQRPTTPRSSASPTTALGSHLVLPGRDAVRPRPL